MEVDALNIAPKIAPRLALALLIVPISTSIILPAQAEVSGNIALVSNYMSYGLSQSKDTPALQLSISWAGNSGAYLGGWASQVDFGEGTDTEFSVSAGYFTEFSKRLSLDIGAAHFAYEGAKVSSSYEYSEIYSLLSTAILDLGIHYSWDYFGSGTHYTTLTASRQFPISDLFTLTVGADYSETGDKEKYTNTGESSFVHYYVSVTKEWIGLQWNLSLHETNMDENETDKARLITGVSLSF
jgi:uncharacterized protein (TIGR02001 family)